MLADRVATSSSKDLERVIEDLMQAIAPNARVPVAGPPEPVTVGARSAAPGLRSSNLRVRNEFTDRDRHTFLCEFFEYGARYFENSLNCQRRRKISPPGRSKTSPLNVMRYAVLGGSCGPTGSTIAPAVKQVFLGISAVFGFG